MKKKRFKPFVNQFIKAVTMFIGVILVSVDDFTFKGFMFLTGLVIVFLINLYLLEEYGG